MTRSFLFAAGIAAATAIFSLGCRSCDSCYDYAPPVANCACGACGTQRAGSASAGYVQEGYVTGEYVPATTPQPAVAQ